MLEFFFLQSLESVHVLVPWEIWVGKYWWEARMLSFTCLVYFLLTPVNVYQTRTSFWIDLEINFLKSFQRNSFAQLGVWLWKHEAVVSVLCRSWCCYNFLKLVLKNDGTFSMKMISRHGMFFLELSESVGLSTLAMHLSILLLNL